MTRAQLYPSGLWRTARVAHRCDRRLGLGLRCRNWIAAGARYFDTQHNNPHSSSPHGTVKLCEACALMEIVN